MSIVNAALSIREERVAMSGSPHYPPLPVYPKNRAWIYEPSIGLAISD